MHLIKHFHLTLILCFLLLSLNEPLNAQREQRSHRAKRMTNDEVGHIALLANEPYFKYALGHILIPRVVGSENHRQVRKFISDELNSFGWTVELDSFKAKTPNLGILPFANIIAHNFANKTRRLSLACHYDSKYFSEIEFLGATDSAVPCAMLVHLAKVITPYIKDSDIALTLIFFDGEEAFYEWSNEDSIYGSRSLAAKWDAEPYECSNIATTTLQRLDMLVLLDLLGIKNQKFYSYFRETDQWHAFLAQVEKKLKRMNLTPNNPNYNFLERSTTAAIEDDHLPFYRKDVPILHVIPISFPKVWHTEEDNYSVLDFPTIDSVNKVLQVFVYAYLKGAS